MLELTNIKNIIFDLGGVIFDIDYNLTVEEFKKLNIKNYDKLFTKTEQSQLFTLLETGKISPNDFRNEIKKLSDVEISDAQIDFAWNAMLLNLPSERLDLLQKLNKNYRLFILSNANVIHIIEFSNILQKTLGIKDLLGYVDKVYFSHEVGMRKPNCEIFEFVLSENNLKANETLFIDDSPQHVESAKKLKINAYHLKINENINKLFEQVL
jgi:putative hydrolase of the HAD superfamily